MGKIVISENVSLDGVFRHSTDDGGFGSWFGQITDTDREAWTRIGRDGALGAEALLLGRRSYEWFVGLFPSRDDEWADRMNKLPKYVVSSTLTDPEWHNSTVRSGDVLTEVSALKREVTGDIVVYGSGQLTHALLEHDLVDELQLTIFPFVLGTGGRLFAETGNTKPLRLVNTRAVGDNLALLTYRPARDV